jgi:hypothetical protein
MDADEVGRTSAEKFAKVILNIFIKVIEIGSK